MAPGRLQGAGVHDICHAGGAQARPGGEVQRASATGKRVPKALLGRQNTRPDPVAVTPLQKKSKSGIKTPQEDVKLIGQRLKRAQQDYESRGTP